MLFGYWEKPSALIAPRPRRDVTRRVKSLALGRGTSTPMAEQPHDDWTMIGLGGNLGGEAVLAARFADAQAEIESIAEVEGKMSSLYRTAFAKAVA